MKNKVTSTYVESEAPPWERGQIVKATGGLGVVYADCNSWFVRYFDDGRFDDLDEVSATVLPPGTVITITVGERILPKEDDR